MNETIENKATEFLTGIRDNLLKPMAAEIEKLQNDNTKEILENLSKIKECLDRQISTEELRKASNEVKWNE